MFFNDQAVTTFREITSSVILFSPFVAHILKTTQFYHLHEKLAIINHYIDYGGFPGGSEVKASAHNVGDQGSIPGQGRSPGERNGNPLQYSCLENPMDRGASQATVHGVTKSRTRLSNFTFTFILIMEVLQRCYFHEGFQRITSLSHL